MMNEDPRQLLADHPHRQWAITEALAMGMTLFEIEHFLDWTHARRADQAVEEARGKLQVTLF